MTAHLKLGEPRNLGCGYFITANGEPTQEYRVEPL